MAKQLHLGAFMRPVGIHTSWWRYPGAWPDANFNLKHLVHLARKLEQGRFDMFFMADHLALLNMDINALRRSGTVTSFEPLTLLSALAMKTERIGLAGTASTTFDAPYHIARRFASLDHISDGRAAWNIVTTSNPDAALNFGLQDHMEHDERYRRAREFYDVVTGLWDSFADDAFVHDVASGIFFDPEKMHVLNHKGKYFSVRGPLNIARPVQGWPVIIQAGASEAGRQLAAETAEVIFGAAPNLQAGRAFYADIHQRMRAAGRADDSLKIMPAAFVVLGDTRAEAEHKLKTLDSLVHPDSSLPNLSLRLGVDVSKFELDAPLPPLPRTNQSQSSQAELVELARREGMTVRQLAAHVSGYGGLKFVGTAQDIANEMQEWLETGGSDGFNLLFHTVPEGVDDVVDKLVPELTRRGIFREAYTGKTLRAHLGLRRPENRFFANPGQRASA